MKLPLTTESMKNGANWIVSLTRTTRKWTYIHIPVYFVWQRTDRRCSKTAEQGFMSPMIYSYAKDLLTKHSIKCYDDLIIANVKLALDMHKVKILESIRLKDLMYIYHYNNHQPLSRCQQFWSRFPNESQ